MRCRFADRKLERLECELRYTGGFAPEVVRAFRKRMQLIRSAVDERDFYALKSLHYEKLRGARQRHRSMRLNDQWRLILEIDSPPEGHVVLVVGIEDYH